MVHLEGSSLTIDEVVAVASGGARVGLAEAARAVVDAAVERGDPVYGINTGFGNFAEVAIPGASLAALQVNLLRSHAAGVGEPLGLPAVRAMMLLRANVLAKGFSGIRLETLELIIASGLPAFLTRKGGLHSGLMMAQVTAAALASEMKTLSHPAGVDTIPTSANREDHVSMSMAAALKAERALELARHVLAVELLCACQGLDLLRH